MLSPQEQAGKAGNALAGIGLTMGFNAFREMYRGILYAFVPFTSPWGDKNLDDYTPAALERAKSWLKEKEISGKGFRAASQIQKNQKTIREEDGFLPEKIEVYGSRGQGLSWTKRAKLFCRHEAIPSGFQIRNDPEKMMQPFRRKTG